MAWAASLPKDCSADCGLQLGADCWVGGLPQWSGGWAAVFGWVGAFFFVKWDRHMVTKWLEVFWHPCKYLPKSPKQLLTSPRVQGLCLDLVLLRSAQAAWQHRYHRKGHLGEKPRTDFCAGNITICVWIWTGYARLSDHILFVHQLVCPLSNVSFGQQTKVANNGVLGSFGH